MCKLASMASVVRFLGNAGPRAPRPVETLLQKMFDVMIVLISVKTKEYLVQYEPYSPDTRSVVLVLCPDTDTFVGWVDAVPSKSQRSYIR